MDYSFKRLGLSDVEDFKKLLVVFAQVFGDMQYETDNSHLKTLLERQDYYAIAAFDKERVIGGVAGYELPLPNKSKELYIYDLAVDEQYRKQGIATTLINELKSHAKKNHISLLFVEAESKDMGAVNFYKSLGLEPMNVEHFNIEL